MNNSKKDLLLITVRERVAQLNDEAGFQLFYLKVGRDRIILRRNLCGTDTVVKKIRKGFWGLKWLLCTLQNINIVYT